MRKIAMLVVLTLATTIVPALADDDTANLEKNCKITRAKAQEIALKKVAGTVTDTDLEKGTNGKCFWSIDVKPSAGVEKELHICSDTGKVLSVETDND